MFSALITSGALIFVPAITSTIAEMVQRDNPSRGDHGGVIVEIAVNTEGRPYQCSPKLVVGKQSFGTAACQSYKRWRLSPPHDASGSPSYAVVRFSAVFSPGGSTPNELIRALKLPVDLTLRIGSSEEVPKSLRTQIAVSEDGKIVNCQASSKEDERRAQVACRYIVGRPAEPLRNENGENVPHVRGLLVGFDHVASE